MYNMCEAHETEFVQNHRGNRNKAILTDELLENNDNNNNDKIILCRNVVCLKRDFCKLETFVTHVSAAVLCCMFINYPTDSVNVD